jgi:hypothetical protein
MGQEIERVQNDLDKLFSESLEQAMGEEVEGLHVLPRNVVFALVVDFTALTMPELQSIRTVIGGGNGPVLKLEPNSLLGDRQLEALRLIRRTLILHPASMYFVLVPWGLPHTEGVIVLMKRVTFQEPRVVYLVGRKLYCMEMMMTVDPLSEADSELRADPDLNSMEMQEAFYLLGR